ncbi:family S53 protease [Mycena vitilis]|nr:family S53 protease [Mycena vitilis]
MLSSALLLAFFFAATNAATDPLVPFASRNYPIPPGFEVVGAAPNDTMLYLKVGLKGAARDALEEKLYDISTPGSANYGKWLSLDEVKTYMTPNASAAQDVKTWLASCGINDTTTSGPFDDFIGFNVSVATIEQMFNASMVNYTSPTQGSMIRTQSYSVPQSLVDVIKVVHPLNAFFPAGSALPFPVPPANDTATETARSLEGRALPVSNATCDTVITPKCLQEMYGLPSNISTVANSSRMGVIGLIQDMPQYADMAQFLSLERPDLDPNTKWTVVSVVGGQDIQNVSYAGRETSLDTQYTVGLISPIPLTFFSGNAGEGAQDDQVAGYLNMVNFLNTIADGEVPQTFSTSFGFDEAWIDQKLAETICDGYLALTSRGASVMFGSGDGGVGGLYVDANPGCTEFHPVFPTSCQFVTSVSATQNSTTASGQGAPEQAANFTGGGFSTYFETPRYQNATVAKYLQELEASGNDTAIAGRFNAQGRAYPDVSAQGVNAEIVVAGNVTYIYGTSMAGPIFASSVALLNNALLVAGKPPLGFLNPLIYAHPEMFFDITKGNNPGCDTDGFSATTGWDPVTGFGTPDYAKMLGVVGAN